MRLNLLPALLEEAYAHMHSCLCASLLQRKLFVQPFHRDVNVTPEVVAAMCWATAYDKQVSCWWLMAGLVCPSLRRGYFSGPPPWTHILTQVELLRSTARIPSL